MACPWAHDNGQGGTRNPAFQFSGSYFQNWQQAVDVTYVSNTNLTTPLPAGQTSDYRAVQVRILYNDPVRGTSQLAMIRRVVTYVIPLPAN